jgi:hypothetical protein
MMLDSADAIERQAAQLEDHFLSTRDANFSFGLFSDYQDADTDLEEEDDLLLADANQAIEGLNERYDTASCALCHRRRQWSESEQ